MLVLTDNNTKEHKIRRVKKKEKGKRLFNEEKKQKHIYFSRYLVWLLLHI